MVQEFVRQSDAVRSALALPVADDWKQLMEKVASDIPSPNAAKMGIVAKAELVRRYQELSAEREGVALALRAVVRYVTEKKQLDPVQQAGVLRALSRYIDQRDMYDGMIAGKIPTGSSLPPYLSKYVGTRQQEQFAVRVTGYMLPLQYDVRDKAGLKESPQKITPLTNEIAAGAVRLKVRMATVLECAPKGTLATEVAPYARLLESAGFQLKGQESFSVETIDAAKFLVAYILKYKTDIEKYAAVRAKGNVKDLTMAEALECAAQSSAVGDLAREVSLHAKDLLSMDLPDIRSFVGNLFEKGEFMPERMLEVALAPLAKLDTANEQDRAKFEENAKAVIAFFRSAEAKQYSAGRLDSYIHNFNEPQRRMMLALADKVTGPTNVKNTVDRLLQAAFIPSDPAKQDAVERQVAAKLQELVVGQRISARDTFDLYYLLETKGSDVLLAYKLVHLLDSYGEQRLSTELQLRLLRTLVDVATSSAGDTEELAKEFNLSAESQVELQNVRQYLSEAGVSALGNWYQRWWSFNVNFPEVAIPLEVISVSGVAIPAGMLIWKGIVSWNVGGFEKFANAGPTGGRAYLLSKARTPAEKAIIENIPAERIHAAQREVVEILGEYDRLGRRFHLFRGGKLMRDGNAIMRAASTEELSDIAVALKRRYPNANDVAEKLLSMTGDEDAIRTALRGAGFAGDDVEAGMSSIERRLTELSQQASLPGEVRGVQAGLREVRFSQLSTDARLLTRELDETMNIADAAVRRDALDAWIVRAKKFQAQANDLSKSMPDARRLLAEEIMGKGAVTDDVWKTVEEMHAAVALEQKVAILNKANLPPDQQRAVKKLARLGIAGESDDAVRAVDVVEDLPAAAREFLRNIDDAEKTGSSIAKLAAEAPVEVLDDAARAGGKAATLSRAAKAGRASEFLGKGALTLEVFIGIYMLYENRQRMAAAEKEGDTETARILKERERSIALASGGGAMSLALKPLSLSLPAAVVLAGGTWYADTLYDHAIELNKSTSDEYTKESSSTLLYNAERLRGVHTTDAVTDGPETREIRRALMLEAFLRKRARTSSGVRAGMAVLDYMTKSSSEGAFDIKGAADIAKTTPTALLETACDVAALYDARETLAAQKLPLSFTYNGNIVDLSLLPRILEDQRTIFSDVAMAGVSVIARQYKAYELQQQRAAYVAIGEIRSKVTNPEQGWSEAADVVRPMILRRLAPSIAAAEARVAHYFTGFIPELQTAAAMLELRRTVLEMSTSLQSAMLNPENSSEQIAAIEKRIVQNLETIDPQKLYDNANSTQGSARFNPLKHGIVTMNTSFGGPPDPGTNLQWRTAGIRDVQKVIEKQLGTPLERCVSALID